MGNDKKTTLYIPSELKKRTEIYCISLPNKKKLNDFVLEAIREKLERDEGK